MPGKDPGPQIKDKDQYEALREKGYSKQKSARISNSEGAEKRGGKSQSYSDRTKEDLYKEAKKADIKGRSKMTKEELMQALRSNQNLTEYYVLTVKSKLKNLRTILFRRFF